MMVYPASMVLMESTVKMVHREFKVNREY